MFTQQDIGVDGKVAVWGLEEQAWLRRWPVDAVEMIRMGVAKADAPKDAPAPPRAKIPGTAVPRFAEPVKPKDPAETPASDAAAPDGEPKAATYTEMKLTDLQDACKERGIEIRRGWTKPDVVKALEASDAEK